MIYTSVICNDLQFCDNRMECVIEYYWNLGNRLNVQANLCIIEGEQYASTVWYATYISDIYPWRLIITICSSGDIFAHPSFRVFYEIIIPLPPKKIDDYDDPMILYSSFISFCII